MIQRFLPWCIPLPLFVVDKHGRLAPRPGRGLDRSTAVCGEHSHQHPWVGAGSTCTSLPLPSSILFRGNRALLQTLTRTLFLQLARTIRIWVVPAELPLPTAQEPGSLCTCHASCPSREMQIALCLAAFETAKYNPLKPKPL